MLLFFLSSLLLSSSTRRRFYLQRWDLLDKPWSHVSSLSPPGTCVHFLSSIGFSIPTTRRFSPNVANSCSRACFQEHLCKKTSLRTGALDDNWNHDIHFSTHEDCLANNRGRRWMVPKSSPRALRKKMSTMECKKGGNVERDRDARRCSSSTDTRMCDRRTAYTGKSLTTFWRRLVTLLVPILLVCICRKERRGWQNQEGDGRQGGKVPGRLRRKNLPIKDATPATNCVSKVLLLGVGFHVLSFNSSSYPIYCVVLFCFVCHISGGGTKPLLFINSIIISFVYLSLSFLSVSFIVHCLYSAALQCGICVLVSWAETLYHSRRENRRGYWVCWVSTGRKNGLMWRTCTHHCPRRFIIRERYKLFRSIGAFQIRGEHFILNFERLSGVLPWWLLLVTTVTCLMRATLYWSYQMCMCMSLWVTNWAAQLIPVIYRALGSSETPSTPSSIQI